MKKLLILVAICSIFGLNAQKPPQDVKTNFTKEVLSQKIISFEGKKQTIAEVLKPFEGKILIIDFWASWCKDCILALPKTEELKAKNPNVDFVYFSLDRSHEQWKKGLEKYGIAGQKNYWFDEGWKNKFNDYIELNWVPRFLVVDQTGKIAHYYAISPEDPELIKTIQTLTNK